MSLRKHSLIQVVLCITLNRIPFYNIVINVCFSPTVLKCSLLKQPLERDGPGFKTRLYQLLLLVGTGQVAELLNFSESPFSHIKIELIIPPLEDNS